MKLHTPAGEAIGFWHELALSGADLSPQDFGEWEKALDRRGHEIDGS
jgi:hypothetical protein